MKADLCSYLEKAEQAIHSPAPGRYRGPVHVGVDLGTAYTVLFVLDANYQPLIGAYQFAQVVRDGVVVDFAGATALLRRLKTQVEDQLGFELVSAATAYPPGVPQAEVRATKYILEAAGLECTALVDEPTAANAVLELENGVVVDIGGGTTGIAIIENGQVVFTADEATGGTHFSLVIAGAHHIPFEQAEELKLRREEHGRLFPIVRPVMEKVGSIIARNILGYQVDHIYLVGGTSAFTGIAGVIEEYTRVPTSVPCNPLFVTPLGIAMHNHPDDH